MVDPPPSQPTPAAGSGPPRDAVLLQLAADAADVGVWDWNLDTGQLHLDDRLLDLFGLDEGGFEGTIESFLRAVHPEDRFRVDQQISKAIADCGSFRAEYRVVHRDGAVRWVNSRGTALAGEHSWAARLVGAAFDSTLVQEGEVRVSRIMEVMPAAFCHLDPEWRFTFANTLAQRLLGSAGQRLVGESLWDFFPGLPGSELEASARRAVQTGEPLFVETYLPPPLDGWYELRAWPSPDGLSIHLLDVSERRAAQDELARTTRRSRLLAEITAALTDTLDTERGVAELSRLLVPDTADWCVITVADGTDPLSGRDWRRNLRDLGWWHHDPEKRTVLDQYAATRIQALREDSFQARALRTRHTLVAADARETVTAGLEPGPARERYRDLDPEHAIFIPMTRRGRIIGLITLGRGKERGEYTDADVEMLNDLAGRAALALDNARVYAAQRDLAEGLQRSLLTEPPTSELLEVAVRYVPAAEAAQVGGDWYDAFTRPGGNLMVVIGDVVGHDAEAAAAMGQVRGLLRGIAVTIPGAPGVILGAVDGAMEALEVATTATVIAAVFEPEPSWPGAVRMKWSNAGHPPGLVVRPDADGVPRLTVLRAVEPDLLMGLDTSTLRSDHSVVLPPGSLVLLYTDGLVERRGQDLGDGIELLATEFATLAVEEVDLGALCDSLLKGLLPPQQEDDVALLAVRVR